MKTTPKPEKKKPAIIKKMSKKERFHRERRQALRQQRLMMKFLKGEKIPSPQQQPKTKRKRTQPQQIADTDETPPRKKTDIRNRDAPT